MSYFRDPNEDTQRRFQGEKETHNGVWSNEPPPWKEGESLGGFDLKKLLGSGSSGFVYRAWDTTTGRHCALKLLRQGPPDDTLRNKLGFRRMMRVEHPNLVRVDRIYHLDTYIALSMEEVEGVTFRQAVIEMRDLPKEVAYRRLLKLVRDFAAGLAKIHAHGLVHRDIKPENLMVDLHGQGRLIDYGLVDTFGLDQAALSTCGFVLGTPRYFSPEVIWSQRYLPAGDIFSLGMTTLDALYSLMQTSSLDEGSEFDRIESSTREDEQQIDNAIQDLSDSIPDTIRDACREMLSRDAADRPTAMEISRLGLSAAHVAIWPHQEAMIGRESELQDCSSWVEGILNGNTGRLHLSGASGNGKTRLLDEVVAIVEGKPWAQMFRAQCRPREDQPMQAIGQLYDAIASRYMEGDRDRISLDPKSVNILSNVFPSLEPILRRDMRALPFTPVSDRLDALEAGVRMTEGLRNDGPLFLVVDDIQWADQDSLSALDRFQSAYADVGLGIITVSREPIEVPRISASKHIALTPLGLEHCIELLATAARRWSVEVSRSMLAKLAVAADGNPFRLRELCDEFRSGGSLAEIDTKDNSEISQLIQMDRFWHARAQRLSEEASQVLPFVVTAGGRVSTDQLSELSGLGDRVDAAVAELARQRLVVDEATGGECIMMVHDQIVEELVKTLSDRCRQDAHHGWAVLLARQDNPSDLAARIAGHFFAAQEPNRAISYAVLAAESADHRRAKHEAGRWYARAAELVDGEEKISHLRSAARCFREFDFPVKAAESYRQLAEVVDEEERIDCEIKATAMLIRGGRVKDIRLPLTVLAKMLGIPRPRSPLLNTLGTLWNLTALSVGTKDALLNRIADAVNTCHRDPQNSKVESPQEKKERRCLDLSLSLIRPMSVFNNHYAGELSTFSAKKLMKRGTAVQLIHGLVGESVFACYDDGMKRIEAQDTLLKLEPFVRKLADPQASGDFWAALAYSHFLSCRWDQVCPLVETSIQHYQKSSSSLGFEIAHTRWTGIWAVWHLGRWDALQVYSDDLMADAARRSDMFQYAMMTSGLGIGAWLARDEVQESRKAREANETLLGTRRNPQMIQLFDWISEIQARIYEGEFANAWALYESIESQTRRFPFGRMQFLRITFLMLGALTALHNLKQTGESLWAGRAQRRIKQLYREQNPFATMIANLYHGYLKAYLGGQTETESSMLEARELFVQASAQARDSHLNMYHMIASDEITKIDAGESAGLLKKRMLEKRVVACEKFARLYIP